MKKIKKKGSVEMTTATLSISVDLQRRFKAQAAKEGKTMSKVFVKMVEEYLKKAGEDGRL